MKKFISILVALVVSVSCFALAVSAEGERTLTVTKVTDKAITFKYTGAKAGDNNWIGVYKKDVTISPEEHSTTSDFYIYVPDGDGELTITFEDSPYTKDNKDTYAAGSSWRNVEKAELSGEASEFKLIWMGGESWYETFIEANLVAEEEKNDKNPSTSDAALAVALVAVAASGVVVFAKKKH